MAKEPNVIGGDTPPTRQFADNSAMDRAADAVSQPGSDNGNLIYILYIVNVVVPFLGIVGVIMAYSARANADAVLRSHYDNQIRIFWVSLIGFFISAVLSIVLIGFLTGLLVLVWKLVRVITGLQLLGRRAPVGNVESFNFVSEGVRS